MEERIKELMDRHFWSRYQATNYAYAERMSRKSPKRGKLAKTPRNPAMYRAASK